jgi:hypothetical protein
MIPYRVVKLALLAGSLFAVLAGLYVYCCVDCIPPTRVAILIIAIGIGTAGLYCSLRGRPEDFSGVTWQQAGSEVLGVAVAGLAAALLRIIFG